MEGFYLTLIYGFKEVKYDSISVFMKSNEFILFKRDMDQLKDKLSGLKGVLNAPGNALNAICDGAR
jgi:hypothetical protein